MFGFFVKQLSIEQRNNRLKKDKLCNSVRNLSAPQWDQSFVESRQAFLQVYFFSCWSKFQREIAEDLGLHSYLDWLPGTEENVCNQFCASRWYGIAQDFVFLGFFSHEVWIVFFKQFIKSILKHSLLRVAYQGGRPSSWNSFDSVGSIYLFESIFEWTEFSRVNLLNTFQKVNGSDCSMGNPTCQKTSGQAV